MASSITSSTSFPISHLSTINVSNFVSSKLRGDNISNNYSSWKTRMLCLIESQGLLQFINGEIQPREREEFVVRKTDRLVMGWILGALDDAVLETVANLTTATDVWLELEKIFTDPADHLPQAAGNEWGDHTSLYKAAMMGDWNEAKAILDQDPNAMEAKLNPTLQTALHVAVGTGKEIDFVTRLVNFMPNHLLELKDYRGFTALHVAAQSGNTKAAGILVDKWPELLHGPNEAGEFPVHTAALAGHKETLEYLFNSETKYFGETSMTMDEGPYLDETSGIKLLCMLIDANIFDVASRLAEKYPYLATVRLQDGDCALKRIALQTSVFHRENQFSNFMAIYSGRQLTNPVSVKMRGYAIKLVKCLCKNIEHRKAFAICEDSILTAARSGIHEIIEEIAAVFPAAIYTRDIQTKQSIFHVAAEYRHRRVFDLINQTTNLKHEMLDMRDIYGNTVLHSAARLQRRIGDTFDEYHLFGGAAHRMLNELLWFLEIEKFFQPCSQRKKNGRGKTAWAVFLEEHAALKEETGKWIKDTSQACSIVTTLIATVTFAAVITVPGGLDSNTKHLPVFSEETVFKAFAWFTIISFVTSINSMFIFLSTNISNYSEQDIFPAKTVLNLSILFTSIMMMIGAFISATYLLLNDRNIVILLSVMLLTPLLLFLTDYIALYWTLFKFPLLTLRTTYNTFLAEINAVRTGFPIMMY